MRLLLLQAYGLSADGLGLQVGLPLTASIDSRKTKSMSSSDQSNLKNKSKRDLETASNVICGLSSFCREARPAESRICGHVNSMIVKDCVGGRHQDEYMLEELNHQSDVL